MNHKMKTLYHLSLIILPWLVLSPCTCLPSVSRNHSNNIQCIDTERDALLQFKHGLNYDDCGLLTSWESHTDCCQWRGVVCSNFTSHVVKLSLTSSDAYDPCLEGKVSPSLGELKDLEHLDLSYNYFYGEIPHQLGNIPSWIGNAFQRLRALILRENHFIGDIPESICKLNSSQILDLASNHLSGVIPHCIGNFTVMKAIKNIHLDSELDVYGLQTRYGNYTRVGTVTVSWKREEQRFKETIRYVKYIDLSSNELSGEIPDGISSLTALGALDLSENKLSGNIPFEIGNLTALEFLDLSNNHLSGEIPISLAKVTTLDVMNMSNNNLSGEIPVSTQLQSFDASSYAGNSGLCGAPLPSCSKDRAPTSVPNGHIASAQNKDDDFGFFLGLYISVVLGFIVGFWVVCGTLVIKTSWRYAYFRFLDNIKDRIF